MTEASSREDMRVQMVVLQAENMDLRAEMKSLVEEKFNYGKVVAEALERITEEQETLQSRLQARTRERDSARDKVKAKKKKISCLNSTVRMLSEQLYQLQECVRDEYAGPHKRRWRVEEEQVYYDKLIAAGGTLPTMTTSLAKGRTVVEREDDARRRRRDEENDATNSAARPEEETQIETRKGEVETFLI